jgi:hypothetical protein
VKGKSLVVVVILALCCGGVFAATAYAAYNYRSESVYAGPGVTGADLQLDYRNYNDSCSGDGSGWTKSIYTTSDGSWVATVESYNSCNSSKSHLGPSSNYGYTYLQSKCENTDSVTLDLICDTTRP